MLKLDEESDRAAGPDKASDTVLSVDNIEVVYNDYVLVLRGLSLQVARGSITALLGANGAGKSTLLRIMGGIDYPDSGRIISSKSISWPMGLSGGFQGSMTGRENAAFIGQIHGFWGRQKKKLLEQVEDFAELKEYFDMPVKTYSSGMRSKLAFGLSVAVHFDYYLVDEVMSVGDAQFRAKCDHVIEEKKKTSNFIIVAHSMGTLRKNCDYGVYLNGRGMEVYEDINVAIDLYENAGKAANSNVKKLPV